jgi:Carboxypeptidase regulatory-like domain
MAAVIHAFVLATALTNAPWALGAKCDVLGAGCAKVLGAMCYVPGARRVGCAPGTDLHGARSMSHLARSTDTAAQIPSQRQRRSAIQGQVTDQGGRGVPGAEVVLNSGTREIARTLTNADGVFRFLDLPGGEYSLTVTHEGYQPLT